MECKRCGKCCTLLELEIMEIDLMREPRLHAIARPLNAESPNPFERTYLLPSPCPFFHQGACMIYDTRPNLCVAYMDECLNKEEQ